MSDPDPDDPPSPAASPPARSIEAARRLSQLLARPLGAPAPPGETPEPYVPRPARSAPPPVSAPPPAPAPEAPDDTASVAAPPPVAPADEPDLPWFDQPHPKPAVAPIAAPEPHAETAPLEAPLSAAPTAYEEPRDQGPGTDDDLFERRDPPPLHAPGAPEEEHGLQTSAYRDEHRESPRTPDHVPDWAWPSALDREPEAAPAPRAELGPPPEPLVTPEPVVRPEPEPAASSKPAATAPPAARPLDPDATRALGNIRRLMLVSNLFMVVAIGAVLAVVGYRIYRTEPAPPPPPPVAAPAPAKIPVEMTLTLPRGARIVGTAVAGDRLVITVQIDGATEIRTFDIKTLQPAGRLSFATVP
jgi:hypothetical protein